MERVLSWEYPIGSVGERPTESIAVKHYENMDGVISPWVFVTGHHWPHYTLHVVIWSVVNKNIDWSRSGRDAQTQICLKPISKAASTCLRWRLHPHHCTCSSQPHQGGSNVKHLNLWWCCEAPSEIRSACKNRPPLLLAELHWFPIELQIKVSFIWTFTEDIMCWFDLHNENQCLCILPLTWLSMKRKCIIFGHSTVAASIPLSLFWVVVNNDQNTHGLLSSFPLSVSASLSRSLYLIPPPMMMARLVSPFVCLLAQTNALISSDLGVSLCKLLFIKRIDSTAAGIKNTCSNREIKSMFLMKRFCMGSSVMSEGKHCRRLGLTWSQYSPQLMWGIILYISF